MNRRRFVATSAVTILAVCCLTYVFVLDKHPLPLTKQRLIGSHNCRCSGGQLKWTFTDSRFEITPDGGEIPAEIVAGILGHGAKVTRIEGKWRLVEYDLCLTDIATDGQGTYQDISLPACDTGVVRLTLDGKQYVLYP